MIYTKNVLNYGMVSKKIFKFKDTDTEKAIELIKYFNPFPAAKRANWNAIRRQSVQCPMSDVRRTVSSGQEYPLRCDAGIWEPWACGHINKDTLTKTGDLNRVLCVWCGVSFGLKSWPSPPVRLYIGSGIYVCSSWVWLAMTKANNIADQAVCIISTYILHYSPLF